jgi:hypothetical protein
MRNNHAIALACALAAGVSHAAEPSTNDDAGDAQTGAQIGAQSGAQSGLNGATALGQDGETLGLVRKVVRDDEGAIVHVVIGKADDAERAAAAAQDESGAEQADMAEGMKAPDGEDDAARRAAVMSEPSEAADADAEDRVAAKPASGQTGGEERDAFLRGWSDSVEDWAKVVRDRSEDELSEAWAVVEENWDQLEDSTERNWERTKASFESGFEAFEQTWSEMLMEEDATREDG